MSHQLSKSLFAFLFLAILYTTTGSISAAPGDILFSDDFENGLAQWSINAGGGDAGISTATFNSANNSLFTRWQDVTVTSIAINTSTAAQIEITAWIRRGDDNFSEDPDVGENLELQYLDDSNNWVSISTFLGDGTAGEIFNATYRLSSNALHPNFQLRFLQITGNGPDWDYWHIDDVVVTEVAATTFSCDDFENGLNNWTVSSNGGDAGISTATFNSIGNSLFTRWGNVTVRSSVVDTGNFNQVEVKAWVRRGDDNFSEDPDVGEDLVIAYLDSNNLWVTLETFTGDGTPGEIFDRTYTLPATAVHNNFQLRITQVQGNGSDWDYWHIDDVCIQDGQAGIAGLIGEWRFDELFWNGTNNEVIDSSGNALHLTAFSAATDGVNPAIAGDPGTCSYGVFNGSVSFIQLDDDLSTADSLLDIPDNLTVTTWINTNVIPSSGLKSILSKDENYEFHINSAGQIYWWWRWATLTTTGPPLTIGRWHHIAVTWRSGEQVIYIDGIERARSARTGTLDLNNDPLQVGQDLNIASRFFDGFIDEVRIYENFLSAAQINQVMNETHPCGSNGICTLTFEDNFAAASYNNSSGTQPWSTDWIESSDDNSATSGNIFITGGHLSMDDNPNSGGLPSLEREMDLNGYISAFITVDFDTSGRLSNGDRFDISVSSDGGNNYTILESFANDFSGTYNYDLSAFMSSNTRIRFRIENNYGNNNEFIDIDNVVITGLRNCGPDHFTIFHDQAGINCLREAITIQANNVDGSVMTDYTGTINLSLTSNNGNWFALDSNGSSNDLAQGVLTDTAGDNNGFATYQFAPEDFGSVTLYLQNTIAETTNISVSENNISDDNSEGDITFRPFGFVFSPNPITTQIAGRAFDLTLTAAGQTPNQTECGVIEEYNGTKSINFWSSFNSPATSPTQLSVNGNSITSSQATSVGQNITFIAGVASIPVQYNDVGSISLHAKDQLDIGAPPSSNLDEIIGGISPFVVRPFGFDIQIESSPYANDSGDSVFRSAGSIFDVTLRSVLWQSTDDLDNDGIPDPFIDSNNDAIPDSGGDLSDNSVTPNMSQIASTINLTALASVVTNSNGVLSTTTISTTNFTAAGNLGEGSYTFSQSWNEAGILQIDLLLSDFMAGGENVTGQRINIGRFIPDHFNLSAPIIVDQCGSFTYAGFSDGINSGLDKTGQFFTVSGTITALNSANGITQNYQGSFAKLISGNISLQGYNTSSNSNTTGRVNFSSDPLLFTNGVSNYNDTTVDYQFASLSAPFSLRVDLSATDSDLVASGLVSSNTIEPRNGRLRLQDSYGPEIANLEMRLFTDYFDGNSWLQNNSDNCSTYINSDISFDLTSFTEQLNNGETSVFSPANRQNISEGKSILSNGLFFSAPGEGNYGSVQVNLGLVNQAWLRFDWDTDNNADDAQATVNFGYYRGSDRIIYWKEIRN
jgi:uncharacterized protein DUF6701/concanavalin A-like lectin/glucanase superfamily protein